MKLLWREIVIPCPAISTLVWDREELVDVTSGLRGRLDGCVSSRTGSLAYPFDRSIGVRHLDTFWSIAYANRGTKGILMKDGAIQRELNRSFYFANAYDYPVAIGIGPSRRVVVIHCPNSFDTLEVEDAETGKTLATTQTPDMEFHSRLAVSPGGRYLLDSGWFWHPLGGTWLCDLSALTGEQFPTGNDCAFSFGAEIDSAAFLDEDKIVVTSTDELVNETFPANGIGPMKLGVWSIADGAWSSMADLSEPSGTIMPWREWVITFHECPKAIELVTGDVVYRWKDIYSGRQIGSIELGDPPPPPMALDPLNGRFAVYGPGGITVVSLDEG